MNKQLKNVTVLLVTGCVVGVARAEFGVSAGAAFNYKAGFSSSAITVPRASDPGAPTAGTDHFYDDGYNRVDESGNLFGQTIYWGYQDATQYDPVGGTIKMNSTETTIDASSSSEEQPETQPSMEVYWQQDLTENKCWNFGVRAALRWQRIELDNRALYGTTYTRISDTYSLGGTPWDPTFGPYSGPYSALGPAPLLDDTPTRGYVPPTIGPAMLVNRSLDADLFGLDVGPTLAANITDRWRAVLSAGGTVAWMQSEFSYSDGALASGSSTDGKCLLGAYLGADVQYQIGKRWGVFAGAAYTQLQDFDQQVDGRSAELQFGESYTLRTGVFFR